MSFETLNWEEKEQIGIITIDRPKSLNALNTRVLDELGQVLDQLEQINDLRAVVITGAGEKAFVAGADIKEIHELNSDTARSFSKKGHQVFRRLEVLDLPVVAAVNGFALGGGLELALACDFIVASEKAVLGLPEVTLGLIPGFGGTQRLARHVSPGWARRLIFSAEKLNAKQAENIGLVTTVLPAEGYLDQVLELTQKLIRNAPLAIRNAKRVLDRGLDLPLDEALLVEQDGFGDLFRSQDTSEGLKAFIEKRRPQFTGK